MELNEQEAHCIARLLQGGWFAGHPIDACQYCKYQCYKDETKRRMFYTIRERLTKETGVDLGYMSHEFYNSEFDYKRFLKNSNEEAQNYFREYFRNI